MKCNYGCYDGACLRKSNSIPFFYERSPDIAYELGRKGENEIRSISGEEVCGTGNCIVGFAEITMPNPHYSDTFDYKEYGLKHCNEIISMDEIENFGDWREEYSYKVSYICKEY